MKLCPDLLCVSCFYFQPQMVNFFAMSRINYRKISNRISKTQYWLRETLLTFCRSARYTPRILFVNAVVTHVPFGSWMDTVRKDMDCSKRRSGCPCPHCYPQKPPTLFLSHQRAIRTVATELSMNDDTEKKTIIFCEMRFVTEVFSGLTQTHNISIVFLLIIFESCLTCDMMCIL